MLQQSASHPALLSALEAPADRNWYILHTHSRYERIVSRALAAAGLSVYLPLFQKTQIYAGLEARVELPLFPSCVFLHGSDRDADDVRSHPQIHSVFSVPAGDDLYATLVHVDVAISSGTTIEPCDFDPDAPWAIVRSGPLAGMKGRLLQG